MILPNLVTNVLSHPQLCSPWSRAKASQFRVVVHNDGKKCDPPDYCSQWQTGWRVAVMWAFGQLLPNPASVFWLRTLRCEERANRYRSFTLFPGLPRAQIRHVKGVFPIDPCMRAGPSAVVQSSGGLLLRPRSLVVCAGKAKKHCWPGQPAA